MCKCFLGRKMILPPYNSAETEEMIFPSFYILICKILFAGQKRTSILQSIRRQIFARRQYRVWPTFHHTTNKAQDLLLILKLQNQYPTNIRNWKAQYIPRTPNINAHWKIMLCFFLKHQLHRFWAFENPKDLQDCKIKSTIAPSVLEIKHVYSAFKEKQ